VFIRVLAFLLGLPLGALQAAPRQPISPPVATAPDFSQEAFVIEQSRNLYRFENDGTGRHESYVRVKVQSEAGVQFWGQLVLGYNAATERLDIRFVRVHKGDGTVVTAPADAVQDLSAPVQREAPMYTDFRQTHVTVPSLRPGETLEFNTITTIHTPLATGHFWLEHDFQTRGVNLDEQLEVDVPSTRTITLKTAEDRTPAIADTNGRRVYNWRSSHIETASHNTDKDQDNDAADDDDAERFAAVRLTTFRSWEELGTWYSTVEAAPRAPTAEIRKKAAELTATKTTDLDKLEALYDFVGPNFRYVSISLGAGRYQPRPASDVLRDQYGDCKDKHTLLASLIQSLGMPVATVLINSQRKIDPAFPSPSQFDHAITLAWAGQEPVWLDVTAEIAPFRLLSPSLRKKQALVVTSKESAHLQETPADPPFLNQQTQEVDGKLGDLGKLTGRVKLTVRGDMELLLRTIFRRTPAANWKMVLERINESSGIGGEISDWKVSDPAATKQPFELEYRVAKVNFVDWTKKDVQLKLPLSDFQLPSPANEKKEIELGSPMRVEYHLRLEMEPGYVARAPMPVSITRDYADYKAVYKLEANVFTADRSFVSRLRSLPADRGGDYSAFRRVVVADDAQGLALRLPAAATAGAVADMKAADLHRSGYEALRAGNYEQAITLLKRVVELEPKNKTAWINLGQAHMGLRQYEPAIEAFKKQVEVNPYDEYAYNNLGRVYALQRRYDEAESAFRKQLEMNPLDKFAHAALGSLFVDAKRYGDAIPELEKAISLAPDEASLHVDLGTAHLNTGHADQAMTAFSRAAELSPTPLTWNNVAYQLALKRAYLDRAQQYAESALSAVAADSRNFTIDHITARELGITQSIGSYLDTLGWVAFANGDLATAERLIGAAWWISEHGEVGDHLGQIAARRGKKADAIRWYALALNGDRPDAATRERLGALAGKSVNIDDIVRRHAPELMRLRSVPVKATASVAGTADFFLLIGSDGRVEAAEFTSGEEKLKPVSSSLRALQFAPLTNGAQALKVLRRATLTCAAACSLSLIPASDAHPPR
jgi:tetratricopeptide (TPR) repeat protein